MRASGAIATEATHGTRHVKAVATRHTRQVAHAGRSSQGPSVHHAAAKAAPSHCHDRALVHNATTARDLAPPHPGQPRHRTSHRHLASSNAAKLRKLNEGQGHAPPRVALRVDAHRLAPALQREAEAAAESGDLRSLRPQDMVARARALWDELRVWAVGPRGLRPADPSCVCVAKVCV